MTALLTGLASLLVFGGVVLVHELGHFMAARHCGIHVEEFSIGFGPRLWAVQKTVRPIHCAFSRWAATTCSVNPRRGRRPAGRGRAPHRAKLRCSR